ncbi:hypothetical protein GCM10023263_60960 [Phytohabitans rumicis]
MATPTRKRPPATVTPRTLPGVHPRPTTHRAVIMGFATGRALPSAAPPMITRRRRATDRVGGGAARRKAPSGPSDLTWWGRRDILLRPTK